MPRKTIKDNTDEIIDKAEKVLDDPVVEDDADQIYSVLDDALRRNKNIKRIAKSNPARDADYENVLLIGEAGSGKTARVEQWARERGVHLVKKLASSMTDGDVGGVVARDNETGKTAVRLSTTELDELGDVPNSVLFLDEFNRAYKSVRGDFLTIINNHTIPDAREPGGIRKLNNFLFTIAAINPATDEYNTDPLDSAERSRFRRIYVQADPKSTLRFLEKTYSEDARFWKKEQDLDEFKRAIGRLELARKLLGSKLFTFDTAETAKNATDKDPDASPLSPRTLTAALNSCDGTKSSFIDRFVSFANADKLPMIKTILSDYQDINLDDYDDIEDKANSALKFKPKKKKVAKKEEPEETVFKKEDDSLAAKLNSKLQRLAAQNN